MANYRRLISYIYAYEGEVKGKNIGFAKLESRGGQCKLSVNVKKVYVGGSDLGVYLLAPGKEIHLGGIFIRGGAGEFRTTVAVENAMDSGISMDACYGLSIHEPNDNWRAYTTIWEDAVAHAAELELADVTSKNRRGSTDEDEIHKKAEEIAAEMERETAGTPEPRITQQNLEEDTGSGIQAEASGSTAVGGADILQASGSFAEAECLDAASVQETEAQQENNPADSVETLAAKAADEPAQEHAAAGKAAEADAVEAAEAAGAEGQDAAVGEKAAAGADVSPEARKEAAEGIEAAAEPKTLKAEEASFPDNNGAVSADNSVLPGQSGSAQAGSAKPWTVQQDSIRQQLLYQSRQMHQQPGARMGMRSTMEPNETMITPASWHAGRVMQPGSALNPMQTPPYERAEGAQAGANPQQSPQPGAMQPQPVTQNGWQGRGENRGMQDDARQAQDNMQPMQGGMQPMQGGMQPMQGGMQPMQEGVQPMQGGMQPMQGDTKPSQSGNIPSSQGQLGTGAMQPGSPSQGRFGTGNSGQPGSRPSPQTKAGAMPLLQSGGVQPGLSQPALLTPAGRPMQPGRPGMPGSTISQPRFGHMQPQPSGGNSGGQSMQPGHQSVQPGQPLIQPAQPPMQSDDRQPMHPAHQVMQPSQTMQPSQPSEQPSHQQMQQTRPPMQPSQPPEQPGRQPMQPTRPPMQQNHPSGQPGRQPMQPARSPMQQGQPPEQLGRQPIQPARPPMQQNQPPEQPDRQPMQPARPPMQQNQPPEQPDRQPMQPARPPMQQNQPPEQPDRQPMQPARPPMQQGQPPEQPDRQPMQPAQPLLQQNRPPMQPNPQPAQPPMQPNQPPMQPNPQPAQPPVQQNRPPMQSNPQPAQQNRPPMQQNRPPMQQNRPPMQPSPQPTQPPMQPNRPPMQPNQPSMQPSPQPEQPNQPPMPPVQPPMQQSRRPTQPSRQPMQPGRHPMQPARRPMQPGRRPMQSTPAPDNTQSVPNPVPAPTLDSQLPDLTEEKEPVIISDQNDFVLGDPEELERLEQEERSNMQPQQLWDRFRKQYPKIQAFDCNGGCEILTIKPQDIGLLPRETWTYGNNSFLLHGYYNYRYLILAKVENADSGGSRYLLGVPGNYYSNEKYMASMFGFPHFVLAKKQPTHNGRFGYWYTDIKLDNIN